MFSSVDKSMEVATYENSNILLSFTFKIAAQVAKLFRFFEYLYNFFKYCITV